MNLKIKYRESFRPFAPSVLEEEVGELFEMTSKSPYMLLVAPVKKELRKKMTLKQQKLFGIKKLNIPRSCLPAVTHVDYSARIQTVSKSTNPRYYELISAFKRKTGCATIVNTSFNVRGEPIVCTPQDAYRCFMRTEMDILVLQNQILFKSEQRKTQVMKHGCRSLNSTEDETKHFKESTTRIRFFNRNWFPTIYRLDYSNIYRTWVPYMDFMDWYFRLNYWDYFTLYSPIPLQSLDEDR